MQTTKEQDDSEKSHLRSDAQGDGGGNTRFFGERKQRETQTPDAMLIKWDKESAEENAGSQTQNVQPKSKERSVRIAMNNSRFKNREEEDPRNGVFARAA